MRVRIIILLISLLLGLSHAQTLPARLESGVTYVSLSAFAKLLGYSTAQSGGSFTVRSNTGVLIVFENEASLLWQPSGAAQSTEQSLSAPSFKDNQDWFVPIDTFDVLGVAIGDNALIMDDNQRISLSFPQTLTTENGSSFEVIDLGQNVPGLVLYASAGGQRDAISVLLVDTGLLGLAFPEYRRDFDTFMTSLGEEKVLYMVVTSLIDTTWQADLTFSQGERAFTVRYPTNLSILQGDSSRVSPDSPVSAVVVLPGWINLRERLTVQWQNVTASMQFRR